MQINFWINKKYMLERNVKCVEQLNILSKFQLQF